MILKKLCTVKNLIKTNTVHCLAKSRLHQHTVLCPCLEKQTGFSISSENRGLSRECKGEVDVSFSFQLTLIALNKDTIPSNHPLPKNFKFYRRVLCGKENPFLESFILLKLKFMLDDAQIFFLLF